MFELNKNRIEKENCFFTLVIIGCIHKLSEIKSTGVQLTKPDGTIHSYDGPKPHAVTSVTNIDGLIPTITQRVTLTSFNKVDSIIQGNLVYTLAYGHGDQRTISRLYDNDVLQKTVYYAGGYEKEVKPGNNIRQIHYIAGGDGLAAIFVKNNGLDTLYYIHTDHLGSINVITNQSGAVVKNYSFDAWGRRRNPTDWTYNSIPSTFLFSRGFTGHEHLDQFDLINMNGRVYDPLLGRFLSPDNFVQSPDFTQSFNRYGYCLNNPLVYNDPNGDWAIITGIVDFFATTFFKGGLSFDKSVRQNAWRNYDPTASWSNTNKAWKIDMGLFKTDPNKNFGGRVWELFSRFTWQAPQTVLGYTGSGIHNLLGGVRSVDYYGGATVVESYSENWGAITLGSYINGSRGITADPNNWLFQHEYGHYIQSQSSGWFYLSKYAIPSLLSKGDHDLHPVEQDANIRALKYFHKNISGYSGWQFGYNPIEDYDETKSYDDPSNQDALENGHLGLSWYDYLMTPLNFTGGGIIIPGLINALILNKNQ